MEHCYNTIKPQEYVNDDILYSIIKFLDRRLLDIMWFLSKRLHSIVNNVVEDNIVRFERRLDGSFPFCMFAINMPMSDDGKHFIRYQTLHGRPIGFCSVPFSVPSCLSGWRIDMMSGYGSTPSRGQLRSDAFRVMLRKPVLQRERSGYYTLTSMRGDINRYVVHKKYGGQVCGYLNSTHTYTTTRRRFTVKYFGFSGCLNKYVRYSAPGTILDISVRNGRVWRYTVYRGGKACREVREPFLHCWKEDEATLQHLLSRMKRLNLK